MHDQYAQSKHVIAIKPNANGHVHLLIITSTIVKVCRLASQIQTGNFTSQYSWKKRPENLTFTYSWPSGAHFLTNKYFLNSRD